MATELASKNSNLCEEDLKMMVALRQLRTYFLNGIEGWQGGQVRTEIVHARVTQMIVCTASTLRINFMLVEAEYGREVQNWFSVILHQITARRYAKSAPRWSRKESK